MEDSTPLLENNSSHTLASEMDDADIPAMISSPSMLTVFLQSMLEGASSVDLVVDNLLGLPEEEASSYMPPPPAHRFSDSSVPELSPHRWEAESCSVIDHARRLSALSEDEVLTDGSSDLDASTQSRATPPSVPTRRCSIESDDSIISMWENDLQEEEECCSSDDEDDLPEDFQLPLLSSSSRWQSRFVGVQGMLSGPKELDTDNDNVNKRIKTPPKHPKRRASLRDIDCAPANSCCAMGLPATNLSFPSEDKLDSCNIQKVHRRRGGILFRASSDALLSMMATSAAASQKVGTRYQRRSLDADPFLALANFSREVSVTPQDFGYDSESDDGKEDDRDASASQDVFDDDDLGVAMGSKDLSPHCAKRRPSPQWDKSAFSSTCNSADASPVRAKRRPSPQFEAFSSLAEVFSSASPQ